VTLDLPGYQAIPEAGRKTELIEIPVASLQPTQWCIGLAEVWARQEDFAKETRQQRLDYLKGKPVPLVRSASGEVWMVDRHHRLRALLGLDPQSTAWGYVIAELPTSERSDVLRFLEQQGWLTWSTAGAWGHVNRSTCPAPCSTWRMTPIAAWCGS